MMVIYILEFDNSYYLISVVEGIGLEHIGVEERTNYRFIDMIVTVLDCTDTDWYLVIHENCIETISWWISYWYLFNMDGWDYGQL